MERCTWVRFAEKLTPCHTTHTATVSTPAGRWMKVQGIFKRRAHLASLILVHVRVGQRCRARDVESSAVLPTMSTRNVPAGRWRKCRRRFIIYANHEDAHSNQSVQGRMCSTHASQFNNARAHPSRSSRDIQPNQPGRPARLDLEDPAPTMAIEHHASGHLRLD
eukprot:scaffold71942_cov69-Phaeocystis_antarctica.AAC.2